MPKALSVSLMLAMACAVGLAAEPQWAIVRSASMTVIGDQPVAVLPAKTPGLPRSAGSFTVMPTSRSNG